MRILPTNETINFFGKLLDAHIAQITSNTTEENQNSARELLKKAINNYRNLHRLQELKLIAESTDKKILGNDETANMLANNGWDTIILEDIAQNFGRHGDDTISCMGEAVTYTNALAVRWETGKVFYRGEHQYGRKLISSAERKMTLGSPHHGLTDREKIEISRFQQEVRASDELSEEIFPNGVPADNDHSWLPAMQHYDNSFGTRLLDLTSSVCAGLYFACIGWDGTVRDDVDGILYAFFDKATLIRGNYFEENGSHVTELDDVVSGDLEDSFLDWEHSEYFRLYETHSSNPRELAQDGYFLVRGTIGNEPNYGQGGYKFRIPAECKKRIIKELWLAGYTPTRMVRGQAGRDAEERVKQFLGL